MRLLACPCGLTQGKPSDDLTVSPAFGWKRYAARARTLKKISRRPGARRPLPARDCPSPQEPIKFLTGNYRRCVPAAGGDWLHWAPGQACGREGCGLAASGETAHVKTSTKQTAQRCMACPLRFKVRQDQRCPSVKSEADQQSQGIRGLSIGRGRRTSFWRDRR